MNNFKLKIIFPPGWTLCSGSPHIAIALLNGYLKSQGIRVSIEDSNFESIKNKAKINALTAFTSCENRTLEDMNKPYFAIEDELMDMSSKYNGQWNVQIGFTFNDNPQFSSSEAFKAIDRDSPFDNYYKNVLIKSILNEDSNVLGFCIASINQIIPALRISKLLRENDYEGFIVFGGNTVSRLINELSIPSIFNIIDGLIIYQGEIPLFELCKAISEKTSLENIPQLIWKNEKGKIIINNICSKLNLNLVSPPDYTQLNIGEYWGANYLNIVASRGCYHGKCNFCAIPFGWGNNGYAGIRSPKNVFEDITTLIERHGINRFKFVDESLPPSFMRRIAEMLLLENLTIEWEAYTRLEREWYDKTFVSLIAKAGFKKGYFGLELFPSENRKMLNKNDYADPYTLLSLCNDYGIKVHLFCMFGFPRTGEKEAFQTLEFILENKEKIDTVDIFPWTYARHTNIDGVKPIKKKSQDWALEYDHISLGEDVLSSDEITSLSLNIEEIIWDEMPVLLHPTYRLISPWSYNC